VRTSYPLHPKALLPMQNRHEGKQPEGVSVNPHLSLLRAYPKRLVKANSPRKWPRRPEKGMYEVYVAIDSNPGVPYLLDPEMLTIKHRPSRINTLSTPINTHIRPIHKQTRAHSCPYLAHTKPGLCPILHLLRMHSRSRWYWSWGSRSDTLRK